MHLNARVDDIKTIGRQSQGGSQRLARREEPIAIVGIGCRFPGGANDPESFWDLLENGSDPITRMPDGRFDVDRFIDPTPGTTGKLVTADGGYRFDDGHRAHDERVLSVGHQHVEAAGRHETR